jgi:hypothetical protein
MKNQNEITKLIKTKYKEEVFSFPEKGESECKKYNKFIFSDNGNIKNNSVKVEMCFDLDVERNNIYVYIFTKDEMERLDKGEQIIISKLNGRNE